MGLNILSPKIAYDEIFLLFGEQCDELFLARTSASTYLLLNNTEAKRWKINKGRLEA
jgi:hypothetical protein